MSISFKSYCYWKKHIGPTKATATFWSLWILSSDLKKITPSPSFVDISVQLNVFCHQTLLLLLKICTYDNRCNLVGQENTTKENELTENCKEHPHLPFFN